MITDPETPRFLILAESAATFIVTIGQQRARIDADLSTRQGRRAFLCAVAAVHDDLGRGAGLMALHRAVRELAAGQPAAGSTVDEVRACIQATAAEIRAAKTRREKKRQWRMTPAMEETLCGAVEAPTYDPLDSFQGGDTCPKTL